MLRTTMDGRRKCLADCCRSAPLPEIFIDAMIEWRPRSTRRVAGGRRGRYSARVRTPRCEMKFC